jgi:hypothetical protein
MLTIGQPVAVGGFGDVCKGVIQGQAVAVKVMRVFKDSDIEAVLKVDLSDFLPCVSNETREISGIWPRSAHLASTLASEPTSFLRNLSPGHQAMPHLSLDGKWTCNAFLKEKSPPCEAQPLIAGE